MKLGILSINPDLYSTRRLIEAATSRGHEAKVIDYLACSMTIASHKPELFLNGESLADIDAIIPRVGVQQSMYGMAVVRQFEMMGTYCVNRYQSIARARDKLRTLQLLSRKGVGLPVTCFAHSTKDIEKILKTVGGAPVVIKLLEGTQGLGVVLAETDQAARSVIEAFRGLDVNILVQEFIKEASGEDLRAFVIGEKVFASIRRKGAPGEFRSNLHRGGSAQPIKLTPEERSLAVRSAKTMGLRIAGVDMLRSNHGPVVMEVNASPGLEGIERATSRDVAGAIVEFIEKDMATGKGRSRVEA